MPNISEEIHKRMGNLTIEDMTRLLMFHMGQNIKENKVPPVVSQELKEGISKALAASQSVLAPNVNLHSYLGLVMEDLLRFAAHTIVSMAAVDALHLNKKGVISEEGQSLLRRGLEDCIVELAVDVLKKHVLNNHADFNKFLSKEE